MVNKDTKEKIPYEDYKQLEDKEKEKYNVYPKLHVYPVFNVDQTNIKEVRPELYAKLQERNEMKMPEHVEGKMFSLPQLDEMIKQQKWIVPIDLKHGDEAYYSLSRDRIVLPEKAQFKDGESFTSNAFHEMAHSTGRKENLDRFKEEVISKPNWNVREELVAELTAALVSSQHGIVKHLKDDSATYLDSWLKSLNEEPKYIKSVLQDVKNASSVL